MSQETTVTRPPNLVNMESKGVNGVKKYTCYPNFRTIMLIQLSSRLWRVSVLHKDGSFKSDIYGVYPEAFRKYLEACNA